MATFSVTSLVIEFTPHTNLRAIAINDALIRSHYLLAFLEEHENSHLIRAFCEVAQW